MPNFFHLEGQNFAFNIDRVDYFIRSQEEPKEDGSIKYLITFYSNEVKVGIWEYASAESRDSQFMNLVTKKFQSSAIKDPNVFKGQVTTF
ncbi:hypothetical protein [Dyadobacter sp. CY356]|jgi:hypothetical protein|uniref:hypothetical protein n=1 Tax=Dyadobacter sp. CY356 TaxID=2906442 RepID=UPI001F360CA3|nr:hypothetical protein [Dyadobacter sp. CY356]MCF0054686.1 hypothetical protein [Dyadobacter sp. CY356]